MNVVEGFGDVAGCLREECSLFDKRQGVLNAGPGESSYTRYDAENANLVSDWIQARANPEKETPWVLFWGIALPHPPNKVLKEYFDYYESINLTLPPLWEKYDWNIHPATAYIRKYFNFENQIDEKNIRRFLAAYYGACSYIDMLIGQVLNVLNKTNQYENTRIVFTADHGEARGTRGIFGKFSMYEESIGIPLIMRGPNIPENVVIDTPVSLVDIFPTIAHWYDLNIKDFNLEGTSLEEFYSNDDIDRIVFAEYHGVGTRNAMFCLRSKKYKYIYHVGYSAELYDLKNDPHERHNLHGLPQVADIEHLFKKELIRIVKDPQRIDAEAKTDQMKRVVEAGGYELVLQRGTFDNTPPPGEAAEFFKR